MTVYATNPADLLDYHVTGNRDDLSEDDRAENELSLREGGRVFSAYGTKDRRPWVITEADCSVTTILRPDD
jgi:hypothetical protein